MTDFTQTVVTRGRITNLRSGTFLNFLYNPSSVRESKGSNIIEDPIPGWPDPLLRWGSGKSSTIKFDLELCGESSLRRRGINILNGAVAEVPLTDADKTLSIAGEIEFFESFQFPVDPDLPLAVDTGEMLRGARGNGGPDLVVLTLGRRYQGVVCLLSEVDVTITEFTPDLFPYRAQLSLTLMRRVIEKRYSNKIWAPPAGLEGIKE